VLLASGSNAGVSSVTRMGLGLGAGFDMGEPIGMFCIMRAFFCANVSSEGSNDPDAPDDGFNDDGPADIGSNPDEIGVGGGSSGGDHFRSEPGLSKFGVAVVGVINCDCGCHFGVEPDESEVGGGRDGRGGG